MHRGDPLGKERVLLPGERPSRGHPVVKAVTLGSVLQGCMVAAGQLLPGFEDANLYPIIGTTIGVVTGFVAGLAGQSATLLAAARRGAGAAGLAAVLAIGAAYFLRQVPLNTIGVAAMTSAVAGLFGGAAGRLSLGRRQ